MANDNLQTLEQWLAQLDTTPKRLIFCRSCLSPITDQSARRVIAHSHHHRFSNPAGVSYAIACFSQAHGCTISGTATATASWFPGYYWQYANCSECHEQLGWYYESRAQQHFFGLISQRLTERLA